MAILWAGGEPEDFPNGAPIGWTTTSTVHRGTYARGAVECSGTSNAVSKSESFGAQTSLWFGSRFRVNSGTGANLIYGGLGRIANAAFLGFGLGSTASKWAILKWDGTTVTRLAEEAGATFTASTLYKVDFQVVSYGASATANLYVDNVLKCTYTGDVTVLSNANLDCIAIRGSGSWYFSECVIADEDTRLLSVRTHAPSGAGDANTFTAGTSADVDEIGFPDYADYLNSGTAAQEADLATADLPAGTFVIKGIRTAVIAAKSGSAPTQLDIGERISGTSYFGTTKALDTGWALYSEVRNTSPATSVAYTAAEVNARQIALRSVT